MQIERKTPINHSGNDRVLGEPKRTQREKNGLGVRICKCGVRRQPALLDMNCIVIAPAATSGFA